MIIELFGTARLRAGIRAIEITADSLGAALECLGKAVPTLDGSVVIGNTVHPAFRVSLGCERFVSDPATILQPDDHLLILAADAGG